MTENRDRIQPPSPSTTPRKPRFPLNFPTISSLWFVAFSRMRMRIETVWSVVSLFKFSVNVFRCGTSSPNAHAYWRKAITSCSDNVFNSGCIFILVVVFQVMHINTHAYCNNFLLLSQCNPLWAPWRYLFIINGQAHWHFKPLSRFQDETILSHLTYSPEVCKSKSRYRQWIEQFQDFYRNFKITSSGLV